MLKLSWSPENAGAPNTGGYARAVDKLKLYAGGDFQAFPKRDSGPPDVGTALVSVLDGWPEGRRARTAAVPVMVHGFDFDPSVHFGGGADDPYDLVFGTPGIACDPGKAPLDDHRSRLPLIGECYDQGHNEIDTAIAFGWVSEGSFWNFGDACQDNDYQYAVLDLAPLAARALAAVLGQLAIRSATVRILAHRLGTRTVRHAVRLLREVGRPISIDRIILIGGAEFCVDAAASTDFLCRVSRTRRCPHPYPSPKGRWELCRWRMECLCQSCVIPGNSFAGCQIDVIHLASRVDTVLALGAEQMCHPVWPNG